MAISATRHQIPDTAESSLPLVVDLEAMLVPADTHIASALAHFKAKPAQFLIGLLNKPKTLREVDSIHRAARIDVIEFLKAERERGRPVYLVGDAQSPAAAHYAAFFDGLIATSSGPQPVAPNLAAIRARVGPRFVYGGGSQTDLSVWNACTAGVLVGPSRSLLRRMVEAGKVERLFARERTRATELLRAMRPHQWTKNLLVFVPLLTSFEFSEVTAVFACLQAFVALSLCASATYIINDLFDLESDRQHPSKRLRPFASSTLRIIVGLYASALLLLGGLTIGALTEPLLLIVLGAYVVTTLFYSLHVKGFVLLDVIVLAALYAIRIIAGAVAIDVLISVWLFAFAFFLFVSLALIKRCAELVMFEEQGIESKRGRDYRVGDLRVLWPLGIGMGVSSILVFAFYLNSPEVLSRYTRAEFLWVVPIALLYWLGRMWIKTSRGEMTDDPLIFALRNRGSQIAIGAMIVATLAAHFIGRA